MTVRCPGRPAAAPAAPRAWDAAGEARARALPAAGDAGWTT